MEAVVNSYDAKIDSKRRLTLRNAIFEYYHVDEYPDGKLVLSPRELTEPFTVSVNTLNMMDTAMANIKTKGVSDAIDLSEFEE